jgi:hypothetical protein
MAAGSTLGYRLKTRKAIYSLLKSGLNPALISMAPDFEVDGPPQFDFSDGSRSVVMARVMPADVEGGALIEFPALSIYTMDAQDEGTPRASGFAGFVIGCISIYLRYHNGSDNPARIESTSDLIEDAILGILNDPASQATFAPLIFQRMTKTRRDDLISLADGWGMHTEITTGIRVVGL